MTYAVKYSECILILTYTSRKLESFVVAMLCVFASMIGEKLENQDLYSALFLTIAQGTILHTIKYALKHNLELSPIFVLGLLPCLKDAW